MQDLANISFGAKLLNEYTVDLNIFRIAFYSISFVSRAYLRFFLRFRTLPGKSKFRLLSDYLLISFFSSILDILIFRIWTESGWLKSAEWWKNVSSFFEAGCNRKSKFPFFHFHTVFSLLYCAAHVCCFLYVSKPYAFVWSFNLLYSYPCMILTAICICTRVRAWLTVSSEETGSTQVSNT